jgi:N-acetylglutamate synthase-like GNAT family acetyltransferase
LTAEVTIEAIHALPDDLDLELAKSAEEEGFSPVEWLREQWLDGTNQFSLPGEWLLAARIDGRLVGICGINQDPYDASGSMGRLRRLYVLPKSRRKGIGSRLVEEAVQASCEHFKGVNLRTLDDNSAVFFESMGFSRIRGVEGVTHRRMNA